MSIPAYTFLPNGMSLLVDADFYQRLHGGDASVGWTGDERLAVYHEAGRIEIWRHCEDGEPRLIVRSRPGMDRLDSGVLRFLAEHDSQSRRGYDARADMDAVNEAVRKEYARQAKERNDEAADRLYHGLKKDIGAYEGGSTADLMTLPTAPWKKDSDAV
jgi:hypothetical protein